MTKSAASLTLSTALMFSIAGCGGPAPTDGPPTDVEQLNQAKSKTELKARLLEIAAAGAAGSATAGMQSGIEALRAEDAALADGLLADLKKLETAGSPAQVKKIATDMAGKL